MGILRPIMENQMEKKMENEMDTGIRYRGLFKKMSCSLGLGAWG